MKLSKHTNEVREQLEQHRKTFNANLAAAKKALGLPTTYTSYEMVRGKLVRIEIDENGEKWYPF